MCERILSEHGCVDVIVNNAGSYAPMDFAQGDNKGQGPLDGDIHSFLHFCPLNGSRVSHMDSACLSSVIARSAKSCAARPVLAFEWRLSPSALHTCLRFMTVSTSQAACIAKTQNIFCTINMVLLQSWALKKLVPAMTLISYRAWMVEMIHLTARFSSSGSQLRPRSPIHHALSPWLDLNQDYQGSP